MTSEVRLGEVLGRVTDHHIDTEVAMARVVRRARARSRRIRTVVIITGALLVIAGGAAAGYQYVARHWFEPSPELLAEERAGELIEGETRILETYVAPEGVTFQLVTYRTTKWRCFDVTAETEERPMGAAGGCGGHEEQAAALQGSELRVISRGSGTIESHFFSQVIGIAGPDVKKIRLFYGDGSVRETDVYTDARVWFAVSSPSRELIRWEPA